MHSVETNRELFDANSQRPSIFEIYAEENLTSSVYPAFQHIAKYLHKLNPRRFAWILKWFDEFYALCNLIVQTYYLNQFGGSLTENFYGLKRVCNGFGKSTKFSKFRSLIMLVFVPYTLKKFKILFAKLSMLASLASIGGQQEIPIFWMIRAFVTIIPWLNLIIKFCSIIMKLAYTLSLTNIHSLGLKFASVHLEKLSAADIANLRGGSNLNTVGRFKGLFHSSKLLLGVICGLFTYSLYLIQFLDIFYNSDAGEDVRINECSHFEIPPPPHAKLRELQISKLETNKCPLCFRVRQNDTVLGVSGYVFCYDCIFPFVRRERKCPITSIPANTNDLIRLFRSKLK